MQLPRFKEDTSDADKTTEYRGRVEVVEVLTDVTMELLPDETGASDGALPARIAAAIRSFPPVAIDPPPPAPAPPPSARRSPDASLEFPHPLPPELYDVAHGDLDDPFDDDERPRTQREPPRWRIYAFAGAMIVSSALVGFAFAGRSRVSTAEEIRTATRAPAAVITTSKLPMPDPETITATATTTTAKTTATTTTASAAPSNAAKTKDTIGLLVTPQWAKGRNVWVDGVIFGTSPKVEAACGKHVVKVGDKGKPRTVNIPCGGKVVVAP